MTGYGSRADDTAGYLSPQERRPSVELMLLMVLLGAVVYGLWNVGGQLTRARVLPLPFDGWWEFFESMSVLLPFVLLMGHLVTAVFFIRWQRQLLRNLEPLGGGAPEFSVEFASWAWFIPIVSWFVPYKSLHQVARCSHRPGGPNTPALIGLWWAAWLAMGLVNRIAALLAFTVESVQDWIRASAFDLVGSGLEVIAGLLAILVLRTLSTQQDDHARRLGLLETEMADHGGRQEALQGPPR